MGTESPFQEVDQIGIIISKVIGDAQADGPFPRDGLGELRLEVVPVPALHDEDEVGPTEQTLRHTLTRARFGSGRFGGVTWKIPVKLLRRAAAPLVSAANEQEMERSRLLRKVHFIVWINL